MVAQSAGFALLAAVSPTALLVMAVFLGSASPRRTALMYAAGAIVMTVVMAVAVLFALRGAGLNLSRERDPRYGLRLGLGAISLAVAAYLGRRKRPAPVTREGEPKRPSLVARLTANPSPRAAFLAGLLLFAPSVTFIAAVQVIATADEGVPLTAVAMLVVVILTAATVWLPLLAYLAFPGATTSALGDVNAWLRRRGQVLVIGALWIAGVVLVVNGALGLAR